MLTQLCRRGQLLWVCFPGGVKRQIRGEGALYTTRCHVSYEDSHGCGMEPRGTREGAPQSSPPSTSRPQDSKLQPGQRPP